MQKTHIRGGGCDNGHYCVYWLILHSDLFNIRILYHIPLFSCIFRCAYLIIFTSVLFCGFLQFLQIVFLILICSDLFLDTQTLKRIHTRTHTRTHTHTHTHTPTLVQSKMHTSTCETITHRNF